MSRSCQLKTRNVNRIKNHCSHVALGFASILILSFSGQVVAETDLAELSIEELMSGKVITATKSEQAFSDTPAAVFVINQNDIRRSGVVNIPEALRMVPGLDVARIDANKWAISARGFNGRFANKLLVLIDGRTVYSPGSSGVYWEIQDMLLEDVERIEVIRGPGASVWGANAVNGIINIITRNASQTKGKLVSLTAGSEYNSAAGRVGGQFADQGFYRLYAKVFQQDGFVDRFGQDAKDDWNMARGGFRMDWNPTSANTLMVQGDYYNANIAQNFMVPSATSASGADRVLDTGDAYGGSLIARWEYAQSLSSRFSSQFYYEHFRRDDTFQDETQDNFDFDFQHEVALTKTNELTWGLGYRLSIDRFKDPRIITITPRKRNLHLLSAFFNDRISLFDDSVELTIGSKFEYHTFSGFEYQPSVRLLWKPTTHQRLWASFSRATRTPSRGDRDSELKFLGIPQFQSVLVLQGNTDFDSEEVLSYEVGYRFWPNPDLSFDVALFYNDYENLPSAEPGTITELGKIPLNLNNGEQAKTWGAELAADWRPLSWMRLQLAYTHLRMSFQQNNVSGPANAGAALNIGFPTEDNRNPRNRVSLRTSIDLPYALELDFWFRYVDGIPDIEVINPGQLPKVNNYVTFDVRLGWKPHKNIELALVGRNLNDPEHLQYLNENSAFPTQVQRSIHGQFKWQFD